MSHVSCVLSVHVYSNLCIDKRYAFELVREFMNSWCDLSKIKLIIFQMNIFLYSYNVILFQIYDSAKILRLYQIISG